MPTNDQRGVVQYLVLILLLIGLGVGIYLVQTKTNLFPKAADTNPLNIQANATCDQNDKTLQEVSITWSDSGAGSYQAQLVEPTGNGNTSECLSAGANSYKFKDSYPNDKDYTVYVRSYEDNNCKGIRANERYGFDSSSTKLTNNTCQAQPGAANSTGATADCKQFATIKICGQNTYKNFTAACGPTGAIYNSKANDNENPACVGTIQCPTENSRCPQGIFAGKNLEVKVSSTCDSETLNQQSISASWADLGAASYQVSLGEPNSGEGPVCLPAGTTSYNSKGAYQTGKNYGVIVMAYSLPNCDNSKGDVIVKRVEVNNASCGGACPLNNSQCCSKPLTTCKTVSDCPRGYEWCYSGYCVNANYNQASDSCPTAF